MKFQHKIATVLIALTMTCLHANEMPKLNLENKGIICLQGFEDIDQLKGIFENTKATIQLLYSDKKTVEKMRLLLKENAVSNGISVRKNEGKSLPYIENLINVFISKNIKNSEPIKEVCRILSPYGKGLIDISSINTEAIDSIKLALTENGIKKIALTKEGKWLEFTKPYPDNYDEWTHWLQNAGGSGLSEDDVVGPPRSIQWLAEPLSIDHDRAPDVTGSVTAGGRFFYFSNDTLPSYGLDMPQKWHLHCRDAFNGRLLWKVNIQDWFPMVPYRMCIPLSINKRLTISHNRVYVVLGFHTFVTELDASTGAILNVYKNTLGTDEILHENGILYLAINKKCPETKGKLADPYLKKIVALKTSDGSILWEHDNLKGVSAILSNGKDKMRKWIDVSQSERVAEAKLVVGKNIVACMDGDEMLLLNKKTGAEIARIKRQPFTGVPSMSKFLNRCIIVCHKGYVLFMEILIDKKRPQYSADAYLTAYSEEGKMIWETKCKHNAGFGNVIPHLFTSEDNVYVYGEQSDFGISKTKGPIIFATLDITNGKVKKWNLPLTKAGFHGRCYRYKATSKYLIASQNGYEFMDLNTGELSLNRWIRGTCNTGGTPANGLLYSLAAPCICFSYERFNGGSALSARIRKVWDDYNPIPVQDPEFNIAATSIKPEKNNWPTFRGDNRRSGGTTNSINKNLQVKWSTKLSLKLTTLTAGGDLVFVGSKSNNKVYSLNKTDGSIKWHFDDMGGIDTPPTYYKNLLIFGSTDGWVYCLNSQNGKLVWKLQAAPNNKQIMAYENLESIWPVNGCVTIFNDVAYFFAGRSTFVDDGVCLYAVNPLTGEVINSKRIYTEDENVEQIDMKNLGMRTDILTTDGVNLYNTRIQIKPKTLEVTGSKNRPASTAHLGEYPSAQASGFIYSTTGNFPVNQRIARSKYTYGARIETDHLIMDSDFLWGITRLKRCEPGFGMDFICVKREDIDNLSYKEERDKEKRIGKIKNEWTKKISISGLAMAAAGNYIVIAGTPDELIQDDPWAPYEGRAGGLVQVFNKKTGALESSLKLEHMPRWDGMIVAYDSIFLSTKNGYVISLDSSTNKVVSE